MMEPDHTGRVDQHVAALLDGVGPRQARKPPPERLTAIGSHGGEAPQMPEAGLPHAVRMVEPPVRIHQERPGDAGLVQILAGRLRPLEGHDERLDLEPIQFLACFLQLQQVSAARQSKQMPVEHQQQPPATVVFEAMLPTLDIPQREGHRGAADEPCHEEYSRGTLVEVVLAEVALSSGDALDRPGSVAGSLSGGTPRLARVGVATF